MTSARRLAANRRNALSSTGPGKARSRLNALRHGLFPEVPVVAPLGAEVDLYTVVDTAIKAAVRPTAEIEVTVGDDRTRGE